MSTPGATHDECMECGALVPLRDNKFAWHGHFALTGHVGYRDVIVEPWKRLIESVEGTCML
jgi:hypothetical protein